MPKKKKKNKVAETQQPKVYIPTLPKEDSDISKFYKMQFDAYIQKRQDECEGLDVCPHCGGVIWEIDDVRKCGDCGKVEE